MKDHNQHPAFWKESGHLRVPVNKTTITLLHEWGVNSQAASEAHQMAVTRGQGPTWREWGHLHIESLEEETGE